MIHSEFRSSPLPKVEIVELIEERPNPEELQKKKKKRPYMPRLPFLTSLKNVSNPERRKKKVDGKGEALIISLCSLYQSPVWVLTTCLHTLQD